jgi:DNA-binding transcriptional LysR family regulator
LKVALVELEFRQVRYFLAVVEELHFRRAAERLHVAQPTISQQIARLEADLGVRLLERSSRSVELTVAGRAFAAEAVLLLRQRDDAVAAARRAAGGEVGRLSIGFVGPAALGMLNQLIRAYRVRFPNVELDLHECSTVEQVAMLEGQQLDVGFLRLPASGEGVSFQLIRTEPIYVLLPSDHSLNRRPEGRSIEVSELAKEPLITLPRDREPVVVDQIISLCMDAGFSPRIVQEAAQMYVIIALVNAGIGLVLGPESLRELPHPGVAYRRLESHGKGSVQTGIAWRANNSSPVLASFLKFVRDDGLPALALTEGTRGEDRADRSGAT